ncbi:MAG: creatininase family protein [Chthoniobacterales bacterium]
MIYGDFTSPAIKEISPNAVAVLPLAATEQHGDHLPIITDTALVTEVAQRLEKALPEKVALLPTLWVGSSHHHLGFPGTISIQSETYVRVLKDLIDSLLKAGFRRVVLLNGHGGNVLPASEALYRVALERPENDAPWVTCATYWNVASRELAEQNFMETPKLTHACEYETSMMLALRLDWVKMELAKGSRVERYSKFYDPLSYTPSRIAASESFTQMTASGAMGSPEKATAEKGEKLFKIITSPLIEFVDEFSEWKFERDK